MGAQHCHTLQLQLNNSQDSQIKILSLADKLRCHSSQWQSIFQFQSYPSNIFVLHYVNVTTWVEKKTWQTERKVCSSSHCLRSSKNLIWVWTEEQEGSWQDTWRVTYFPHTADVKNALKVDKRLSERESRWGELKRDKTCIFTTDF